jgi:hypothetical protein
VEQEKFLVPIVYGGKEKYVSRLEGDPNLDKKVQITLPIMSFQMLDMKYDAGRKLNTFQRNTHPGGTSEGTLAVYNPVPFDFDFELYAYVRNIEDGAQLMEKILPYFTPDYTLAVNMIPEMGIVKQLPIILNDVSHEIDYEGDYNSKVRSVIWTLKFTVKGYLYGPVSEPKIIRTSFTNIIDDDSLQNKNVVITLNSGGFGNFKEGETVYQGYSFDTATATATVFNWNSNNRILTVNDTTGHFVTTANVIGVTSNSKWSANSFAFYDGVMARVMITPNPEDVILPNNYTYKTTISEAPFVRSATYNYTFDETDIDFSNTIITMDSF